MPRVSRYGRSARATLDGSAPRLRHFRTLGCTAVILAVGAYKNKGLLAPPGVVCVYVGVGLRRNMTGAMFVLADGRTVVSQHYRLDETKFPGIPSCLPPGIIACVLCLLDPADDPYDAGFRPPSSFVAYEGAPCMASAGVVHVGGGQPIAYMPGFRAICMSRNGAALPRRGVARRARRPRAGDHQPHLYRHFWHLLAARTSARRSWRPKHARPQASA
jgi:hypothetical protein